MRIARISCLVLGVALLATGGCSSSVPEERTDAQCTDGLDTDEDGLVDCEDPDCRARSVCAHVERDRGVPDVARPDLGSPREARSPDRGADAAVAIPEAEPNDGKTATEYQGVALPVAVRGAIGIADDTDVFSWTATAGDRLSARLKSDGTLEPHLSIFGDQALKVPSAVSAGAGEVMAEYYVLKTGRYYLGVRDRRNVGTSQHVGGAGYGYLLTVAPLSRPPVAAVVGGEVSGELTPPGTVGVFSFSVNAAEQVEVTVLAARLSPPSALDSRLSLFHPGQQAWLNTNDDRSPTMTDSLLSGALPFNGTYHAIVENEGVATSDLRFKLKITRLP